MKKFLFRFFALVFLIAALIFGFLIGRRLYEEHKSRRDFQALSDQLSSLTAQEDAADAHDQGGYHHLQAQNPDLIGWIHIKDTSIDYPVMHTPEDPEYYLSRNFSGEYSAHGTPFLDFRIEDVKSAGNLLVYGHHMNDGTMFADLIRYSDFSFWESHPIIDFDTMEESAQYQIVFVLPAPAWGRADDPAFYLNDINPNSEEDFNSYLRYLQGNRLYDTGISLSFGEKRLTLTTCDDRYNADGRLVVVAKKISTESEADSDQGTEPG